MSAMSDLAVIHDEDEMVYVPTRVGVLGRCPCGYETAIFRGRSRRAGGAYAGVDADLEKHLREVSS